MLSCVILKERPQRDAKMRDHGNLPVKVRCSSGVVSIWREKSLGVSHTPALVIREPLMAFALDSLFKDVCIANSFGGQRWCLPLENTGLFIVIYNNVFLQGKNWGGLLAMH